MPTSFWLMASDVSERLRRQVAERAYHVCEYCLIHEDDTFWGCQVHDTVVNTLAHAA